MSDKIHFFKIEEEKVTCPACGATNEGFAVFCEACDKALGDFRYVKEEFESKSNWLEKLADKVTQFTGQPLFVVIHLLIFSAWIVINSGIIASFLVFDNYPYELLALVLSIEAILITSFVLISGSRQSRQIKERAELDYEYNTNTYRALRALHQEIHNLIQSRQENKKVLTQLIQHQKKLQSQINNLSKQVETLKQK